MLKIFNENLTLINSFQAHSGSICHIRQSPFDSEQIVTGSYDYKVKIWKVLNVNWTLIRTYTGHACTVFGKIEWINEDKVASADMCGMIQLWSLSTGVTNRTISNNTF